MKLVKIGERYINPEKVSVVFANEIRCAGGGTNTGTVVIVGDDPEEYAQTSEDIESVVKKLTQEGGAK